MVQNNIENQIKDKLKTREIQPSAQAWDRLDAMLTVVEEKKNTRRFPFWLLSIAASFLVLLTVGLFFFNQEKTVSIPTNEMVVTPEVQNPTIINEPIKVSENEIATINENNSTINNQPSTINHHAVSVINQKNNHPIINRKKEIEYLVSGDVALKDLPKVISTETIVIQTKKQLLSKKATYVNVDALLASAENPNNSNVKSDKIKVNANTLLSYADSEVETTFREKVIHKINKNYLEVKSALATRNQE